MKTDEKDEELVLVAKELREKKTIKNREEEQIERYRFKVREDEQKIRS